MQLVTHIVKGIIYRLGLAIDKPSAEFEVAAVQVATCYKDGNLKATQNIGNLVVYGA